MAVLQPLSLHSKENKEEEKQLGSETKLIALTPLFQIGEYSKGSFILCIAQP